MLQNKSCFEQSNLLDVTIQCQFNVATKNVMEFSTTYSSPSQQTTPNGFPIACSTRPFNTENITQCRLDNITPTKPTYQCEFEAQERYYVDSVPVRNPGGLEHDQVSTKAGHVNSFGYNNHTTGYYFSCMNDSGYCSPVVQMGLEKNSAFSPCAELSRPNEQGSPVFENSRRSPVHTDIFNQCTVIPGVNSGSLPTSPVQLENSGNESHEMKIAVRERDVMQRLFSLRSVNSKAANDIDQYYQMQTTTIDIERHNVLCQTTYNKESADSVNKYYNRKLLSLLECVEGKLSASEMRKCKGMKCKTTNDRKSRLLPKHAVKLMQTWYDENLENPYPSREVTLSMASNGCVTVEQIRKWFANKRNRSRNNKLKACDIEADL